jgi:hypothetical protein
MGREKRGKTKKIEFLSCLGNQTHNVREEEKKEEEEEGREREEGEREGWGRGRGTGGGTEGGREEKANNMGIRVSK